MVTAAADFAAAVLLKKEKNMHSLILIVDTKDVVDMEEVFAGLASGSDYCDEISMVDYTVEDIANFFPKGVNLAVEKVDDGFRCTTKTEDLRRYFVDTMKDVSRQFNDFATKIDKREADMYDFTMLFAQNINDEYGIRVYSPAIWQKPLGEFLYSRYIYAERDEQAEIEFVVKQLFDYHF